MALNSGVYNFWNASVSSAFVVGGCKRMSLLALPCLTLHRKYKNPRTAEQMFMKCYIVGVWLNSVKFKFWLKLDSNNGNLSWRSVCFCIHFEDNLLNICRSHKCVRQRLDRRMKNTFYVHYAFSISLMVFEIIKHKEANASELLYCVFISNLF